MGFLRFVLREYLHQRHRRRYGGWFGGPSGRYPPQRYGYYGMGRGRHGGLFDVYRPRPRARVRGCGCCLPIPVGVLGMAGLVLRLLLRVKPR